MEAGRRAIDRSEVDLEVYPGAANDIAADVAARRGWICEEHPDKPWPHGDRPGPGTPPPRTAQE